MLLSIPWVLLLAVYCVIAGIVVRPRTEKPTSRFRRAGVLLAAALLLGIALATPWLYGIGKLASVELTAQSDNDQRWCEHVERLSGSESLSMFALRPA